jgi:hypothetical protein
MTLTLGKTPAMAFVLTYLREFPGADYHRVKAAAMAAGVGVPHPVIYGNALRVLKKEAAPRKDTAARRVSHRRHRGARGVGDLAGLVEQMRTVVEDRDRLRAAVDQIRAVIKLALHGGPSPRHRGALLSKRSGHGAGV